MAIGFIIDDAIVVLENIVRRQEEGKNRVEASLKAPGTRLYHRVDDPVSIRRLPSDAADGRTDRKNIK